MVNDDGVVDVLHHYILKHEVPSCHVGGVFPRLDPHTVRGAGDGAVPYTHTDDVLLVLVPPQAADADAMSRAALDLGDSDVGAAVTEGDAVVAGADDGLGDLHVGRPADVNAVGVGAVPRCPYGEGLDLDVLGPEDVHVEHLTVDG